MGGTAGDSENMSVAVDDNMSSPAESKSAKNEGSEVQNNPNFPNIDRNEFRFMESISTQSGEDVFLKRNTHYSESETNRALDVDSSKSISNKKEVKLTECKYLDPKDDVVNSTFNFNLNLLKNLNLSNRNLHPSSSGVKPSLATKSYRLEQQVQGNLSEKKNTDRFYSSNRNNLVDSGFEKRHVQSVVTRNNPNLSKEPTSVKSTDSNENYKYSSSYKNISNYYNYNDKNLDNTLTSDNRVEKSTYYKNMKTVQPSLVDNKDTYLTSKNLKDYKLSTLNEYNLGYRNLKDPKLLLLSQQATKYSDFSNPNPNYNYNLKDSSNYSNSSYSRSNNNNTNNNLSNSNNNFKDNTYSTKDLSSSNYNQYSKNFQYNRYNLTNQSYQNNKTYVVSPKNVQCTLRDLKSTPSNDPRENLKYYNSYYLSKERPQSYLKNVRRYEVSNFSKNYSKLQISKGSQPNSSRDGYSGSIYGNKQVQRPPLKSLEDTHSQARYYMDSFNLRNPAASFKNVQFWYRPFSTTKPSDLKMYNGLQVIESLTGNVQKSWHLEAIKGLDRNNYSLLKMTMLRLTNSPYNIHPNRLLIRCRGSWDVIQEGSFGTVYLGYIEGLGNSAVKVPNSQMLNYDSIGVMKRFINEWDILTRCSHRNIVTIHGGIILGVFDIWLCTELVNGIDLHTVKYGSRNPRSIPMNAALKMCRQLAEVLVYLHTPTSSKGVVIHRDIKPENIIVDSDWNIKLCDFGDAFESTSGNVTAVSGATWLYAPPELLLHPAITNEFLPSNLKSNDHLSTVEFSTSFSNFNTNCNLASNLNYNKDTSNYSNSSSNTNDHTYTTNNNTSCKFIPTTNNTNNNNNLKDNNTCSNNNFKDNLSSNSNTNNTNKNISSLQHATQSPKTKTQLHSHSQPQLNSQSNLNSHSQLASTSFSNFNTNCNLASNLNYNKDTSNYSKSTSNSKSVLNLSEKWDIWSAGCVFQEMFGYSGPFHHLVNMNDPPNVVCEKMVKAASRGLVPNIPSQLAKTKMGSLILQCLDPNPDNRPTAKDIKLLLHNPDILTL